MSQVVDTFLETSRSGRTDPFPRSQLRGRGGMKEVSMRHTSRKKGGASASPTRVASAIGVFALAFTGIATVGTTAAMAADDVTDTRRVIDLGGITTAEELKAEGWTHTSRPAEPVDWEVSGGAIRVSNAVLSSNLNFLITPRLAEKAGEPVTGAAFDTFEASFRVAAVGGEYQEGLRTEISVNDDKIARTGGTLVLHHKNDKLQIGAIWTQLGDGTEANDWYSDVLAEVDPAVAHTVRLVFRALEGAQDTLDVYVDDAFVATVGTYEEFHLVNEQHERKVASSLLFRAWQSIPSATGRGFDTQPAVPETAGKGFLFDEISYEVKNTPASTVGDSIEIDLGGPSYLDTLSGAPGGQHGWFRGFAALDNGIVDGKLRISNATVSGIQNQLTAPQLGVSA